MHRRNYGRRSGMIIDTCQLHGLWFDQGELAAILDWIHTGGLERAERHSRQLDEEESRLRQVMTGPEREADSLLRSVNRGPRGVSALIEAVLRFLTS
jgi:Zn-finger nucleic acid-binding protein